MSKYTQSKSAGVNTTNGMGANGHFLLNAGTPAKVFTRLVSTIEVKSGTVLVVSAKQNVNDPEHKADYPDWANETLGIGIHNVNFKTCSLSGATFVLAHYGV